MEEASSPAAEPAVETARANSRDMASSRLKHSDVDGKVELVLVNRKLVRTSRSAAATKGSWAETQEMGSWYDMVQTRHAGFPQECRRVVQCAWNQAANPTTRHAEPAAFQVAEYLGHLSSSDLRNTRPPYEPHTTQSTDTTLPPCKRSTVLWPAEPSSRNRCAAPRTLAPAAPGHLPRIARSGC